MEQPKSHPTSRNRKAKTSNTRSEQPATSQESLGKRSPDSQVSQTAAEATPGIPISESFGLMNSITDVGLQRVRAIRNTTTNKLENTLDKLNAVTCTFKRGNAMTPQDEAKIRSLPQDGLRMTQVLQNINEFTDKKERIQRQHVTRLQKKLTRTEQKKVEATVQEEILKELPHERDPSMFENRYHLEKKQDIALAYHNSHIIKLASCLGKVSTLCLKCWEILFVSKNSSIPIDKATRAQISVDSDIVFEPSPSTNKSVSESIRWWAKCSKLLLKPTPGKPCRQDFFPHVILPQDDIRHTCWDMDSVEKVDLKSLFLEKHKALDPEYTHNLLKGSNSIPVEVNDPQISSGHNNSRRVFKPKRGASSPLKLDPMSPPQASVPVKPLRCPSAYPRLPLQLESPESGNPKPLGPVLPQAAANDHQPGAANSEPPKTKKKRLIKANPPGSNTRSHTDSIQEVSHPQVQRHEQKTTSQIIDEMSLPTSESTGKDLIMNLLTQQGDWKFLNFKTNDGTVKVARKDLLEAYLSNN
jgi:hypothetical protein